MSETSTLWAQRMARAPDIPALDKLLDQARGERSRMIARCVRGGGGSMAWPMEMGRIIDRLLDRRLALMRDRYERDALAERTRARGAP